MPRPRLTLPTLMVLALAGPGANAAEPGRWSREVEDTFGARVNGLGVENRIEARWRRELSASEQPLLSEAHVSFGVSNALTPAYTRIGAFVEVAPLSILVLRAGVEPSAYFGTFSSILSFSGYDEPFDDDTRRLRRADARGAWANRLYFAPTLQMKAGPVVATSSAELEHWQADAAGPLFYEPARDTLLDVDGGRCLTVSSALLWQRSMAGGGSFLVGAAHRLVHVSAAPGNRAQALGVVVVRQLGGRRFGLGQPTVSAQVAKYLAHPFRDDQWTAAAGLSFHLDRLER